MNVMRTPLGDSHNGKSAEFIKNEHGEFIRKPRGAEVEHAFEAFLHEMKKEGFFNVPRCVKILRESDAEHDVEIVKRLPAKSEKDVQSFFERCGVLLFLSYIFGSNDLHRENLIANGDSPVLIDLETLLTGKELQRGGALNGISLRDTVMRSHLLTNWMLCDSSISDCGGITGSADGCGNTLELDGKVLNACDYEDDIISGFSSAYDFALKKREKLSDMLGLFSECHFRKLMRPTQVYAGIIAAVKKLDEGQKKLFAGALLKRAYDRDIDPERFIKARAIYDSEVSAVLCGDIPLFLLRGDSKDLFDAHGIVMKDFLLRSPTDAARDRLDALCCADKLSQTKIISNALASVRPFSSIKSAALKPQSLTQVLYDIVERTEKIAVPSLSTHFMCLDTDNSGNVFLQSAGFGVYDGIAGILCMYAAVYRKTGDTRVLDCLRSHYECLKPLIEGSNILPITDDACSMQSGAGGIIAALLHIGELTGEDRYRADAEKIASRIDTEREYDGDNPELLCSAASLALSLPKISRDISVPLAKHLAKSLSVCTPTLTGAAHGAAGIALELAAVQYVLYTDIYDEKIISLLRWENGFFDGDECNWRDLRKGDTRAFMCGWCSGAPGIGMSRAAMLKYTHNIEIKEICENDIKNAKKRLLQDNEPHRDTLCCGLASHLTAASMLGTELPQCENRLMSGAFFESERLYHPLDTCDRNASLMQGLSGVGYALAMSGNRLSGGFLT